MRVIHKLNKKIQLLLTGTIMNGLISRAIGRALLQTIKLREIVGVDVGTTF